MTRRNHSRAGFTLVELLVGMSLALVVMTGVLSTFAFLGRNLNRLANQQQLESEARRALAYFAQDVRMASGLSSPGDAQIELAVTAGTVTRKVIYFYNGADAATTVDIGATGDEVSITAPGNSLVRFSEDTANPNTGNTVTLLRNLLSFDLDYRDLSDNAVTDFTNKVPTIKRVAKDFRSQTGVAANGTLTPVYPCASPFLTIRNKALLE